jgi:hypothetical protein
MNAISRKTHKWLQQRILVYAVKEDVNGPFSPEVNRDVQIANSAPEFRKAILEGIQAKEIFVPLDDVDELARRAASEAYVVRGFNEAWLSGEITKKDLRKFPLYSSYREYFERSPRVWALALDIAGIAAEQMESPAASQN